MKMDIITLDGKKAGSIDLPEAVFGAPVRKDLLHRAVTWQLARRRAGTASTKVRSEVSYTTAKMYAQKGTGRARHGSRSPGLFRGGAVVFGPRPRSHETDMPKKVRRLALATALSAKVAEQKCIVIDEAKMASHKTKDLASKLKALSLQSAVFIVDSMDEKFDKASRNIPHVTVLPTEGANVYDILRADTLVVTKNAVAMLEARLSASKA